MSAVRNMDQMEVLVLLLIFGNIHTQCCIPLAAEIHDGMLRAYTSGITVLELVQFYYLKDFMQMCHSYKCRFRSIWWPAA